MRSIVRPVLRRASLREFGWLSMGNQLGAAFALLSMLVLARSETLTAVGQVVFAQAFAGVVLLVLDIRFEDALQRYFPIVERGYGRRTADAFFWRTCRWDLALGFCVISIALMGLAFGLTPSGGSWVPSFVTTALVAAGVGTVLGSLNSGFAVTGHLSQLARISMATAMGTVVLTIGGVVIGGAQGYLYGQLAGTVVQVLATMNAVRRHIPWAKGIVAVPVPTGLVRFLAKSSAASSLAVGSESGVLTVGGIVGSAEFVALLKVAQAPARAVATLFSPLAVQAFPRLAQYAARGDKAGVRRLTSSITTKVSVVALVVCLVATPLMRPVIGTLYGEDFAGIWPAAVVLLAAASARAAVAWSKVLPLAIGRPGIRLTVLALESCVLLTAAYLTAVEGGAAEAVVHFSMVALVLTGVVVTFWLGFVRRLNDPGACAVSRRAELSE